MIKIGDILKNGGIGVMATDTIYGLIGSALSKKAIARIYKIKRRNPKKPLIILIVDFSDLAFFGVKITPKIRKTLTEFWPGKVSVILPCRSRKFFYLHRGSQTLAFRLPAKKKLRDLLRKTGPLAAPSANPEGKPPAKTIKEAKNYFGDQVDFYANAGKLTSKPSTLLTIRNGRVAVIRP